jgi:hypothetical protein
MKHFALKAFEYFPFEVILSDVQGIRANSPRMLKRATVPCSAGLPAARHNDHLRSADTALQETREQIGR